MSYICTQITTTKLLSLKQKIMKTIYTITNRNFTSLEFAQKFADKNSLDYSLISTRQIEEYNSPKNVFIGKESQEKYNERHANYAK